MGTAIKFSVELTLMRFQTFVPLSDCGRKTEKQSEGQIYSHQNCRSLIKQPVSVIVILWKGFETFVEVALLVSTSC